jgi:hypothetical protein
VAAARRPARSARRLPQPRTAERALEVSASRPHHLGSLTLPDQTRV